MKRLLRIILLCAALLAPLLLSNVTNLHPVAVIVAVLVFGGLWGFWAGRFLQVLLKAWLQAHRGHKHRE